MRPSVAAKGQALLESLGLHAGSSIIPPAPHCCRDLQVDACQQHASLLLEDQPDNEDAAIMLAEIMAHQVGWTVRLSAAPLLS